MVHEILAGLAYRSRAIGSEPNIRASHYIGVQFGRLPVAIGAGVGATKLMFDVPSWSRAGKVPWILDDEGSKWKDVGWRGDGLAMAEIIGAKRKEHHLEHLV